MLSCRRSWGGREMDVGAGSRWGSDEMGARDGGASDEEQNRVGQRVRQRWEGRQEGGRMDG